MGNSSQRPDWLATTVLGFPSTERFSPSLPKCGVILPPQFRDSKHVKSTLTGSVATLHNTWELSTLYGQGIKNMIVPTGRRMPRQQTGYATCSHVLMARETGSPSNPPHTHTPASALFLPHRSPPRGDRRGGSFGGASSSYAGRARSPPRRRSSPLRNRRPDRR